MNKFQILKEITGIELIIENPKKYNPGIPHLLNKNFIHTAKKCLGSNLGITVAKNDDILFAVQLCIIWNSFITAVLVSVDRNISLNDKTYFVFYYRNAKRIENEPVSEINFGNALYKLKKMWAVIWIPVPDSLK